MRAQWRLLLAAVLALSALAGAATTAAGAAADPTPGFVIVDEPDEEPRSAPVLRPLPPERSAAGVEQVALREAGIATALRLRPGSDVRVTFLERTRSWRVVVRDRGSSATLAQVEVDDRTGRVVGRSALARANYPTRLSERQAVEEATSDDRVRRAARAHGGLDELDAQGRIDGCCWEVDLYRRDRSEGGDPVVRVDVDDRTGAVTGVWTGIQVAWTMARGERRAFGGDVNEPWVWIPLLVLFALVAVDWTRLRSWPNADVAAILALGVSHEFFLRGLVQWSVPLALPPLLWLLGRMAWIFLRGLPPQRPAARPRRSLARLALRPVPLPLLVVFCVALAGVRIGLALDGGNVIDVGHAGLAGARLEIEGRAPWGNMPEENRRGDTYGPANYLAYVPATLLLDDVDEHAWGGPLPAAQATTIAADLGCVLLLACIGWRWISRRAAALLAAAWLACPWTTWALASGVNDALVALPVLAAVAVAPRSILRGGLVALAAMVKFAPIVALAPLLHLGRRQRLRQSLLASLGAAAVVALGLLWVVVRLDAGPLADLRLFWERTVGFQSERGSPFSVWGLYGWHGAQRVAQVLVVLLVLAAAVVPRARDAWQATAGAAAAIIAAQLVVTHWFYLYVPWFIGLVLVVLVAARERPVVEAKAPAEPDMLRP